MKKLLLSGVILLGLLGSAQADNTPGQATTIDHSLAVTTGNTFQTAVPAAVWPGAPRLGLLIQNNNTSTDNCWVFPHATTASTAKAILLAPGGSYSRYFPYVPADAIQVTCATAGDTLYIETN